MAIRVSFTCCVSPSDNEYKAALKFRSRLLLKASSPSMASCNVFLCFFGLGLSSELICVSSVGRGLFTGVVGGNEWLATGVLGLWEEQAEVVGVSGLWEEQAEVVGVSGLWEEQAEVVGVSGLLGMLAD